MIVRVADCQPGSVEAPRSGMNWDRRSGERMIGSLLRTSAKAVRSLRGGAAVAESRAVRGGRTRARTHEGLSSAFLNEVSLLVQNAPIPGDDAAPAVLAGFQG